MDRPTAHEMDETARLILMDATGGMIAFTRDLRKFYPDITAESVAMLWAKYRGFDGRKLPTHSIETGEPL